MPRRVIMNFGQLLAYLVESGFVVARGRFGDVANVKPTSGKSMLELVCSLVAHGGLRQLRLPDKTGNFLFQVLSEDVIRAEVVQMRLAGDL